MKPKITNSIAWEQAELLMQPILIRIIDNIRKQLDNSTWQGTYQDIQTPVPGYILVLERQGQQVTFDIWELCYQVCFSNYRVTHAAAEAVEVDIDTSLIDITGDVDWQKLEDKTLKLVENLFKTLPNLPTIDEVG